MNNGLDSRESNYIRAELKKNFEKRISHLLEVISSNKVNFYTNYIKDVQVYQLSFDIRISSSFSDFISDTLLLHCSTGTQIFSFINRDLANKIYKELKDINIEIEKYMSDNFAESNFLQFNRIGKSLGITGIETYTRDRQKEEKPKKNSKKRR